jgi:hypothetical protein
MTETAIRAVLAASAALAVLAAPAAGEGTVVQVPVLQSNLDQMIEAAETMRFVVVASPGPGTDRDVADREAVRDLLSASLDVAATGDIPGALEIVLQAGRPLDRVHRGVRYYGDPADVADYQFQVRCITAGYSGRVSLAAALLGTVAAEGGPDAAALARASAQITPMLGRANVAVFPVAPAQTPFSSVRSFRILRRAALKAARWCEWTVLPEPPPPEE